ncbi:MAG: alpha/beta hydrolase [Planctomycetia bacterium]|nr:alpha/beta hydrolase [Planctomycetia bacterium]
MRPDHAHPPTFFAVWGEIAVFLSVAVLLTGCSSVRMLRSNLPSPGYQWARQSYYSVVPTSIKYTDSTLVVLRTLNLDKKAYDDPDGTIAELENTLQKAWKFETVGVIAEVAFVDAKRKEKYNRQQAGEMFLQSAKYAYAYLFDVRLNNFRNPYDPAFANMCRIYNESTEAILRLLATKNVLTIDASESFELRLGGNATQMLHFQFHSRDWTPGDIATYRFASDFDVTGFKNRYRVYGLGVPMIAECKPDTRKSSKYQYCIANYCLPMTVFLRMEPNQTPVLEFYDPMDTTRIAVADRTVPMEIDFTTPLAYSMQQEASLKILGSVGLFRPDRLLQKNEEGTREIKGIYMAQPFNPDKIPVLMVHGLWSSPLAWMEMYNTLNSIPDIREHYQIWFYFYPNGQPFWVSAAQFRDDLARLRRDLDPQHTIPNLDQMVLVGHSMGGLISTLQTVDSEDRIWNLISDTPVSQTRGSETTRDTVDRWFHYTPNPSVRCVITMATPFRGSKLANSATSGLTEFLGKRASLVEENLNQFVRENKSLLKDKTLLNYYTSIDSLQIENPFWPALLESRPSEQVAYYNIIGVSTRYSKGNVQSDGVVTKASAELPWAETEYLVDSEHSAVPSNPQAILDVAKILHGRISR